MTASQLQHLEGVVFSRHQVANNCHDSSCDTEEILLAFELEKVLVFSQSIQHSDKTLFFDVVLANIELLQACVSLKYLSDLPTTPVFQTILGQIKTSQVLADFDRACDQPEQVVVHLDAFKLQSAQFRILNQVVIDCHNMKLGQLDVAELELDQVRERDQTADQRLNRGQIAP